MRSHHEDGAALARGAGVPKRAATLILHARESWDGSGPGGLRGQEIPLGSRIIAAAQEYVDAPYAPGAPAAEPLDIAIDRLQRQSGERLDPVVADIVLEAARAD